MTSESTIGKSAKTRLPNSIVECSPIAGKNAPFWQPGHDWQARPEPVSRTAAPGEHDSVERQRGGGRELREPRRE